MLARVRRTSAHERENVTLAGIQSRDSDAQTPNAGLEQQYEMCRREEVSTSYGACLVVTETGLANLPPRQLASSANIQLQTRYLNDRRDFWILQLLRFGQQGVGDRARL